MEAYLPVFHKMPSRGGDGVQKGALEDITKDLQCIGCSS
jgi:hypothetical protein